MVKALVRAVEALHKCPLHRGDGCVRKLLPSTQLLPIIGKRPAWIDHIDFLDAEGVHVPDDRPDISQVARVLKDSNQVLAAKGLDLVGAQAS